MAKSATPLINLRYQVGSEGSPSNPAKFKNQDFAKLRDHCLRTEQLFVDNEFPPDSRSLGDLPHAKDVTWLRPANLLREQNIRAKPAFCVDGASRFDFGQGRVGDCWFVATISALTVQKDLVAQVVPMEQSFKNYAGIFHFRFWRFGKWVDVVIDDYLPTINKHLLSLSSKCGNEFWAPLLEKAYAKVCGSYADMNGGFPSEACKDFTGGVNQTYRLREDGSPDHEELWHTLRRATGQRCKSLICCWTPPKEGAAVNSVSENGLVYGHAYSVTGVMKVELSGSNVRLVRVMNPWGKQEWNGKWSDRSDLWNKVRPEVRKQCFDCDDGEFWMQLEDFCSYFSYLSICCETPNFTDGDFTCQWKCMDYDGSWVAGRSAGGALNNSTFASNPQYHIQVSVKDKEEPEDKNILISLMQKPQQRCRKAIRLHPAGLAIYKVPAGTPQGCLDVSFFKRNRPVRPQRSHGLERELIELHSLEPGEYVIVPFITEPCMTADFVLTVYTKADASISGPSSLCTTSRKLHGNTLDI